ncbi:hypothetical protein N9351_04270 [Candidatus Thioglobus sp.]|nr:hypothetical protein [Candidatus Thioglobus sp.]
MKKIRALFAISWTFIALGAFAAFGLDESSAKDHQESENSNAKTAQECEVPSFAKAIGHEELWLKHNGCPPTKEQEKSSKE